ncbi:MAG: helix-turn-helix transcriptional regulator [Syntrophaceae bacterium]
MTQGINIIGYNIKSLREKRKLRQEDIASFLGVSREMVSYYESGARNIPLDTVNRLADFFQVELEDLLEENPDLRKANIAFAFRAGELGPEDFQTVSDFHKIVKNYIKIKSLCEKHGC